MSLLLGMAFGSGLAQAAPGDLDTLFGLGGKLLTPIGTAADTAQAALLQSGDKIVVAGYYSVSSHTRPAIARYLSGGALDISFGTGGKATSSLGGVNDCIYAAALQPDGKIILTGWTYASGAYTLATARYLSDGSLDASFGTSGVVKTGYSYYLGKGGAVTVQSDGKILVAGKFWDASTDLLGVVRYTANGELDPGFGSGGVVAMDCGWRYVDPVGVCQSSSGKVIVGVSTSSASGYAIVQLNSNGSLDAGFGTGGKTLVAVPDSGLTYCRSLSVRADGSIVLAGEARSNSNLTYDLAIMRFLSNGNLDSSFGGSGIVSVPVSSTHERAGAAGVQPDGKVVVGFTLQNGSVYDCGVCRLNANGTLDTSFASTGRTTISLSSGNESVTALTIQSDGNIIVAGTASNGTNDDFTLFRLKGDPVIPPPSMALSVGANTGGPSISQNQSTAITIPACELGTPATQSFTISNTGGQTLMVSNISVPAGFTALNVPASVLAGSSATFQIRLNATSSGLFSGSVQITNSDPSNSPFSFPLSGTVTGDSALPEIVVHDGANVAADQLLSGQASVVSFGATYRGTPVLRTFTIYNAGGQTLSISSVPGPAGFLVLSAPSSIAPLTSATFQIKLIASSCDHFAGNVTIHCNDANEAAFRFPVSGSVTVPVPSELDPTFGSGGFAVTPVGSNEDYGNGMALQPDGKILLAGSTASSDGSASAFGLVRFLADGNLDSSFGTNGKVTTPFGTGYDSAEAVAVQTDGRILVVGSASVGSENQFAVARYLADGSLDSSFGGSGKVVTSLAESYSGAQCVALQPDGKILVAGSAFNGSDTDFALVRYTSTGTLDTAFGNGGKVTMDWGSSHDGISDVVIQTDGRIVVAGWTGDVLTSSIALARFSTGGEIDSSFGTGGKVVTAVGPGSCRANDITLQPDGKILVAGVASNGVNDEFMLARYTSEGELDGTFGSSGRVTTPIGSGNASALGVALQHDGKVVAVGGSAGTSNDDFAVVRYLANGSLDTGFGSDGKTITPIGTGHEAAHAVLIQPDGRIVVGGWSFNRANATNDFAVLRYLGGLIVPPTAVLHDGASVGSALLAPGQAAPIHFGFVGEGSPTTRSFTLENTGDVLMSVTSITVPAGFTVLAGPASIEAPGSAVFQVRLDAVSAGAFSGNLVINSNDPEQPSFSVPVIGIVQSAAFHQWIIGTSLSEAARDLLANPSCDGVPNLAKFAFNLDPTRTDFHRLEPGTGTSGLPTYSTAGNASAALFRIEYVRRKNSGITYTPLKSTDLSNWLPFVAEPVITAIDGDWERVVIDEPYDALLTPQIFGSVRVFCR